jgi:alpha-glucosidase
LVHDLIKKFRRIIDKYPGKVMIGETYLPAKELMAYYGENGDECHFPFNFGLITEIERFRPPEIADYIEEYYRLLPSDAWPNWVFDNHDVPRIVSPLRAGPGNAGPAAVLLFTLGGTITAYYGDEIAMQDADIPPDRVQDPKALREPDRVRTRDSARTPMQWDSEPYAGFSTVEPWLPVSPDYRKVNVDACEQDPHSFLHLFRKLAALRRKEADCISKEFQLIAADEDVLAYRKGALTVVLNFSGHRQELDCSLQINEMRILFSSAVSRGSSGDAVSAPLTLEPHEGLILKRPGTATKGDGGL